MKTSKTTHPWKASATKRRFQPITVKTAPRYVVAVITSIALLFLGSMPTLLAWFRGYPWAGSGVSIVLALAWFIAFVRVAGLTCRTIRLCNMDFSEDQLESFPILVRSLASHTKMHPMVFIEKHLGEILRDADKKLLDDVDIETTIVQRLVEDFLPDLCLLRLLQELCKKGDAVRQAKAKRMILYILGKVLIREVPSWIKSDVCRHATAMHESEVAEVFCAQDEDDGGGSSPLSADPGTGPDASPPFGPRIGLAP